MTEEKPLYLNQPAGDTVHFANVISRTAMFSFEAIGEDRKELRNDVVFVLSEMVDGPALGFPGYMIKRIVQFQVSESYQFSGIQKWRCDVYVLAEIAPEPTALNRGLTAAWKAADAELEALGDESPDVVAGVRGR